MYGTPKKSFTDDKTSLRTIFYDFYDDDKNEIILKTTQVDDKTLNLKKIILIF